MRVALVHSYHHSDVPSGENVVVDAQVEALAAAGHEAVVVAQDNDTRSRRRTYPLEAAATVVTGVGPDPSEMLRRLAPDVVHVHNLFPNFGTRWLARWPGPLVATLHNFRPICPAGTLLRDGHHCTDCVVTPMSAVRHRCFQHSRVASLPLALATRGGATRHPVVARADRLIAISARAAAEYEAVGVEPRRLVVVPNAVPDTGDAAQRSSTIGEGDAAQRSSTLDAARGPHRAAVEHEVDPRWLFVGRLSAEKGARELLERWPAGLPIDLVGAGEIGDELAAAFAHRPEVRFLGAVPNTQVRALVGRYTGLVVPSLWAEAGPPLTYVEALASGVPVVAVAGNGAADDIALRGTGLVVGRHPDPAELAVALKDVQRDRARLSPHCRAVYEAHYATGAWVRALLDVYREASHA